MLLFLYLQWQFITLHYVTSLNACILTVFYLKVFLVSVCLNLYFPVTNADSEVQFH